VSMGAIVAVVMIAGRALAPVSQLAFMLVRGRQAMMTLDSLETLMESPDERQLATRSVTPTISHGLVEFSHVDFRYPGASIDSLSDLSLRIEPGERIGVIGRVA